MLTRPFCLGVIVLAALSAGCTIEADSSPRSGTFERTFTVNGPVDMDVRTGSGSIRIVRGAADHVRVTGRVRVGRVRVHSLFWSEDRSPYDRLPKILAAPPITQTGNSIRIGVFADPEMGRNVSISYDLLVPETTRVESRTGSGNHDIDSLQGPIEARTGSGSIRVGRIAGEVRTNTGSGNIDVEGAGRGLIASTGSGSLRARRVAGPAHARSGSGNLDVEFSGQGDGDFQTGSGSIVVAGLNGRLRVRTGSGNVRVGGAPTNDWSIDTGSGGISLQLPANAAFDLDARANGAVHLNHPLDARGLMSRSRVQGKVRGGGPYLSVSASSGNIRVD